jgi:hypothetical protein
MWSSCFSVRSSSTIHTFPDFIRIMCVLLWIAQIWNCNLYSFKIGLLIFINWLSQIHRYTCFLTSKRVSSLSFVRFDSFWQKQLDRIISMKQLSNVQHCCQYSKDNKVGQSSNEVRFVLSLPYSLFRAANLTSEMAY